MQVSLSSFVRIISFAAVIAALLFLNGCVPPPQSPNQANTNIPANSSFVNSAPAPVPTLDERAAKTPFTLPLLDAMLTDETFVNEAKTATQISDEEIQKLRDAARNAVLNLSENGSGDDSRSTQAAVDEARKQVDKVLGDQKASVFVAFVQERWAGQGNDLAMAKPNGVPTDTRIVVNAPAYRMDIFKDGKLIKSYKIGIGYPEFPLPTGLRKVSSIIFNPTWTPPDEPWVKGDVQPGKKVEAGSKLNPLGPIKIPIGLPSLIHGGKSPARLGTFASHGCVGLTDMQIKDFTTVISGLSGDPISLQEIKAHEKTKTVTQNVKLEQAIPIELRYETIVVENGSLKIYRDVYEKGTNTEENLNRVLETFGVSLDSLQPADREKILTGLDQMASNAKGKPVDSVNANSSGSNKSGNKSNSGDGSVTRNIKGKKEVVFQLKELAGKGYPAPVGVKM